MKTAWQRFTRPMPEGYGPGLVTGMIIMIIAFGLGVAVWLSANPPQTAPPGDPVPHYLPACEAEDGGPELPCIWGQPNKEGEFILYTR